MPHHSHLTTRFLTCIPRWTHALTPLETYNQIVQYCNFSIIGPIYDELLANDDDNLKLVC